MKKPAPGDVMEKGIYNALVLCTGNSARSVMVLPKSH